jgi:putative transposase
MNLESGGIYHIYNQGNNHQLLFYNRENYQFFLRKIRDQIQPFGNILAWCLMPNHFHLMMEVTAGLLMIPSATQSRTAAEATETPNGAAITQSSPPADAYKTDLNHAIGILLASYTRAINIQENRSGSLFRQKTKAICLNGINGLSPNWNTEDGVAYMNVQLPESQYLQVCFNYIHANPVKARLVEKPEDWEFSSYPYLKEYRNGNLVNKKRVIELGLVI